MDFRFTEEQEMIAETLESLLGDICSTAHLRKMIDAGQTYEASRWQALAELGLCGVLVPEDLGGLGLSEIEFVRIAEICGAFLLPEPLVESAGVALPLLAQICGTDTALKDIVAQLAVGEGHAVLFHPAMPLAAHADTARFVLRSDGKRIKYGRPGEMGVQAQLAADPLTPLFSIAVGEGCSDSLPSEQIEKAVATARDRGALFAAARMTGIAQSALDQAVAYAREREQFGKPIGSYQAVKHRLAEVQVAIEFVRPVLYAAAALVARGDDLARAHVAHAWLRAGETVRLATERAVHVHGAMGYSWEADIHLFLKRALVLSRSWGSRDLHLEHVAMRTNRYGALDAERLFGDPR
ncbi:acyl-CoA dehydrogenase family protein [Mesorhizobium xinjiangense]|uniref:acyl-CoA dehydrogenase family protein n=1 Tax=Mesorhizobium xinjiangense TaxID=2678685 RepID=UPI0012EDDB61|nr:acyl-CoA dehydrogenase family protein [Mesorhizobium xinjiangense]